MQQEQYPPPPPQYPPPPPQYSANYPPQQPPNYGQTVVYGQPATVIQPVTTTVITQPVMRHPNDCAYCGGTRRDQFTLIGIILALLFFPIGIICCIMMTEKRCTACGR